MNKVLSIVFNEFTNDNRVLNQALSLKKSGYDVTILALRLRTDLPKKENIKGVRVLRVFRGYENKLLHSIPYVRLVHMITKFYYNFLSALFLKNYDVIHCHDLNTLQFGVAIKVLKGKKTKLIYDAHEYETQMDITHGFKQFRMKIKERCLIKFSNKVITVSDSIADEYVRLYGISKPTVILNCPVINPSIEPNKYQIFRDKFNIPETNQIFLYQGYFMVGRGIEIILKAFTKFNDENFSLVFMGNGPLSEKIRNNKNYNKSVYIHPFADSNQLIEHTSSADFGISFIEDVTLSDRFCLPNKLFEYIGAGIPVIASDLPEMKKFVETYKVGVVAEENDADGFLAAFKKLLSLDSDELDRNIKKTRKLYHWGTQEKILIDLYQNLELK